MKYSTSIYWLDSIFWVALQKKIRQKLVLQITAVPMWKQTLVLQNTKKWVFTIKIYNNILPTLTKKSKGFRGMFVKNHRNDVLPSEFQSKWIAAT